MNDTVLKCFPNKEKSRYTSVCTSTEGIQDAVAKKYLYGCPLPMYGSTGSMCISLESMDLIISPILDCSIRVSKIYWTVLFEYTNLPCWN